MQQDKIQEAAQQLAASSRKPANDGNRRGALVIIDQQPPVADNTTIMLYTVKTRAVDERQPTAYFSLGLTNVQVCNRLIAIQTGIDQQHIDDGTLTDDEWKMLDEKLPQLMQSPLYIDDTEAMPLADLQRKMADLAQDNGVNFMVIDHAQRVTADGLATADILTALQHTAEDLRVVAIAIVDKD